MYRTINKNANFSKIKVPLGAAALGGLAGTAGVVYGANKYIKGRKRKKEALLAQQAAEQKAWDDYFTALQYEMSLGPVGRAKRRAGWMINSTKQSIGNTYNKAKTKAGNLYNKVRGRKNLGTMVENTDNKLS